MCEMSTKPCEMAFIGTGHLRISEPFSPSQAASGCPCLSNLGCVAQFLSPCLVLFVSGFRCFQSRRHEHPSVLALLCVPVPLCPSP